MIGLRRLCSVIDDVAKLRDVLEGLYARYNHRRLIAPDPLQFVYRYRSVADKEIVGFLSAALAYGRVEQIEKKLTKLFSRMGDSPRAFVLNFGRAERKSLVGFRHRFTSGNDISDLLRLLRSVLEKEGSIEKYFLKGYNAEQESVVPALSRFCESLLGMYAQAHNGKVGTGLKYLLSNPANGSACKRLNLFLRWMVRDDEVDTGLWKGVDKAKLIVPVDVHIGRLCRILGLYEQKTVSLAAAKRITESFAEIEPADPVKYDFALSRIGIVEQCNGRYRKGCEVCELYEYCFG